MIPKSVKVAGINYSIIKKHFVEINSNRNYRGQCDSNKGTIELAEGLSKDIEEQIFVRELVHACLDQAGYDEQDEEMVTRFSIVLHQVLKDNNLNFNNKYTNEYAGLREIFIDKSKKTAAFPLRYDY